MNRIYSLVWSAARGCLTVASEVASVPRGGQCGLASRAVAVLMVGAFPVAGALAQSTATTWTTTTPQGAAGSAVNVSGSLGTANVSLTTRNYFNAGLQFASNWTSLLPVSYQPISGQGSMSLGYIGGAGASQSFSFSEAVTDPVLMFNFVDLSRFDFSGLNLDPSSPITFSSSAVQGSLSNGVLTITNTVDSATEGFSVRLLGSYTSPSSFTVTSTASASAINSVGFGIATLTAQLPNSAALPNIVIGNNRSGNTGFNLLSNVAGGSTFVDRFDGGTLTVDTTVPTTGTFTITANNGFIDQNGTDGTFSGVFSNDGAAAGRLVILNSDGSVGQRSGRVILGAANTHSGGTEVRAGATLQIASAAALGTGPLVLVGTANETATLAVTANTTIANAITVAGDPTFDIATGTTTTISSVIADGASAGDVVKTGAGILNLTAANTYTGPTTINQGTLRLTGAGSIAQSTSVTNTAVFDVTPATGNVALGGSYSQSANGTLRMTLAPANNQQVQAAGAANVGGTLDVTAAAGTYRAGRYTLMTSGGLNGSRFATLTTNLATVTAHSFSLGYDASNVYLDLRASVADTLRSMQAAGAALNQVYSAQYGIAQAGLSYDCKRFDTNNFCLSTGVRTTHSQADGSSYDGVALIAAQRVKPDLRVGGWVDQNVSRPGLRHVVAGNETPMLGAFAVWNENPITEQGWQLKFAGVYGEKNLTITRPELGTAESGRGSARLSTVVAEASASYGIALGSNTSVSPFAGLRHVSLSHGGYTEAASVFSPLSFAKTRQSGQAVVAGLTLDDKAAGPVGVSLSAGVEHFVSQRKAQISASGLDGLTPVALGPALSKTRPFASAMLRYDIDKKQQLLLGLSHSKQFTQSDWVSQATVRYVVGL